MNITIFLQIIAKDFLDIYREIQSQQELKPEPFYNENKQNTIDHTQCKQVQSDTVSLEDLTGEQVIINNFTGEKHTIMQEPADSEVNNIEIERTEMNQCSKQNPEMYLAHEDVQDIQDTCVETTEIEGNEISDEQPGEKTDNKHAEETDKSELEQTPASTSEIAEIDSVKNVTVNKDSTDSSNLQEFAEGHDDEPMEIEETHTTDVITTNSSKIAEVEEVCIK